MDKIGIDLDSVICNTGNVIINTLKNKFNLYLNWEEDFMCRSFERNINLTKTISGHLYKMIENGSLFTEAPIYENADFGMELLREEEIKRYIITARGEFLKDVTIQWLERNNVQYDKIYFSRSMKKKDLVYELELDAFIDDRYDILTSVLEKCGPLPYGMVVIDQPWNRKYRNVNIRRAYSFVEACKMIISKKNDKSIESEIQSINKLDKL